MNGTISLHYVYLYIDNFNAFYFRGWKWTCKWNAKDQSDVGFLFDWICWTLVCFLWLIWKFGLCITFICILCIFYSIYENHNSKFMIVYEFLKRWLNKIEGNGSNFIFHTHTKSNLFIKIIWRNGWICTLIGIYCI